MARALKAELQGQQAEMEENVGQEEEEGEEEASASEMSMRGAFLGTVWACVCLCLREAPIGT